MIQITGDTCIAPQVSLMIGYVSYIRALAGRTSGKGVSTSIAAYTLIHSFKDNQQASEVVAPFDWHTMAIACTCSISVLSAHAVITATGLPC